MLLHATLLLGLASLLRADQGEIVGGEEAAPHSIPWQVSSDIFLLSMLSD